MAASLEDKYLKFESIKFRSLLKCPYYAIFKVANIVLWVS